LSDDKKKKEIRAISYLLKGDIEQKKLLEKNIGEFRKQYHDLDKRLDKLKSDIINMEGILKKEFNIMSCDVPNIYERAKEAGPTALNIYNLVYSYYSNVEHHSYLFGQAYVDMDNCEPLVPPYGFEKSTFFIPEILITMARGLFISVLEAFNSEFRLSWIEKIKELAKIHDEEYEMIDKPEVIQ
jgi:hypothetical protein